MTDTNSLSCINYGIIGAGSMGREHIRHINMIDGIRVAAIADPNDEQIRLSSDEADGDIACFKTNEELISSGMVDAYILATPNFSHVNDLPAIFAANKPVLIEKPLCTTTEDCRKMIALAEASSAPVWVGMEYRYMDPIAKLAKMVHQESIGKLKMLTIREHRRPFLAKVDDWNRFSRNSGGTLVEKCCHFFDLMRFIIQSEPVSVFASGAQDVNHLDENYNGETPDILDNAFVIVNFEGGQRAMLELCMFAEGPHIQETVTAVGDKARALAMIPRSLKWGNSGDMRPATLEFSDRASGETTTEEIILDKKLAVAGAHYGSTYYEHLGFLDMIRTGRAPDVSLKDGLIAVSMGEAAQKSIKTGQVISLR